MVLCSHHFETWAWQDVRGIQSSKLTGTNRKREHTGTWNLVSTLSAQNQCFDLVARLQHGVKILAWVLQKRMLTTTATATKTSLKKWIRAASNFIALIPYRLIRQFWPIFLELNSKRLYQSSGKEKESCLVFPSSTRREIGHFHVVVVQPRQRNVQKSVMHVRSCCFANINQLLFCCSRCRHRCHCLSSQLTSSKYCTWTPSVNASLEVTWDTVIMLLAFGVHPPYTKEHIVCKKLPSFSSNLIYMLQSIFYFSLFVLFFLCFKFISIRYHTQKQWKNKN